MHDQLVTSLVPILADRSEAEFNVFDVMHHGTHEKQLSNVFAWLLDTDGSHKLDDAFQRIFIDEVNRGLGRDLSISKGEYSVRQEVNTSESGVGMDIADLVLEDDETTIVVENYYTSDGHGHNYEGYLNFGARDGKRSVVVLLCENESRGSLTDGWENAPVVVYASLLERLHIHVDSDSVYKQKYPELCSFFEHMHRRFAGRMRMNDESLVDFINVLCKTGEAGYYGMVKKDHAAISFGDHLREEAMQRFEESVELLTRVKHRLRDYCRGTLRDEVNEALGEQLLGEVRARYVGRFEWFIALFGVSGGEKAMVHLEFGPTAWVALEETESATLDPDVTPDYTRLLITTPSGRARQSEVSLNEVLDTFSPDDTRLRDEVVQVIRESD